MKITLTSLFNTSKLAQVKASGGIVYTAMVSPLKGRTEPNTLLFAATKELVFGHKAGCGDERFRSFKPVSDEQYTQAFLEMLDYRTLDIDCWIEEQTSDVAITCSCMDRGKFCHLDVVALWLRSACPTIIIERI